MLSFKSLRLDNAHLLADPVEHTRTVELANAQALEFGLVQLPEPVLDLAAQSKVSLGPWQTGFRSQLDRATCYAFAACAAMEAAYRRQFGLVVDLSEHYVFHINKVTALLNDWVNSPSNIENNSTLIGFQGSSDMVDKLARFAAPDEVDAPYLTQVQMAAIRNRMPATGNMMTQPQNDAFEFDNQILPMVAHQRGRYQVETFAALPDRPSVDQVKRVLQAGFEVVADIKDHCFLIIGYDDALRVFEVKNSWGENAFIQYLLRQPGPRRPVHHKSSAGQRTTDRSGLDGPLVHGPRRLAWRARRFVGSPISVGRIWSRRSWATISATAAGTTSTVRHPTTGRR